MKFDLNARFLLGGGAGGGALASPGGVNYQKTNYQQR